MGFRSAHPIAPDKVELVADRGSASAADHYDDDRVTVITPSASAHASAGPVEADLAAGADIIPAASVDVLTSASPAGPRVVSRV